MNGLTFALIITCLLIACCWRAIAGTLHYIMQGFSISKAIELARNSL